MVVHADPWWNAAATDQATDRAHRIGQNREVDVYTSGGQGTIEERIVALQEAKRDLADSVIAATAGEALAGLTRERLAELLGDEELMGSSSAEFSLFFGLRGTDGCEVRSGYLA